jgi:L-aspartate oxidase
VALDQPACPGALDPQRLQLTPPLPPVQQSTRQALWSHANVQRDAAGLQTLADDPHPLARMIAVCALERCESRGAHQRTDHPETDPKLDLHHLVLEADSLTGWQTWE